MIQWADRRSCKLRAFRSGCPLRPTTVSRIKRREGELALNQGLVLTPETFVRDAVPIRVTGAEAVRSFIGLGAA